MARGSIKYIKKLELACAIQAAIVAARDEGADTIRVELEELLAGMQPDISLAA